MQAQADSFTDLGLTRAIDSVAAALAAIREGDEPRMTMELALLRAARPQLDPGREAFAQRLERVEQALAGKAVAPPAPPAEPTADKPSEPAAAAPASGISTPEPAREDPGPEPEAAAEAIDLDRLIGLWPAVMDQVKSGSELLSHALSVARPIAVDVEQAVVQVGFPVGEGFSKRKAEAVEAKERLADAVKTILGERLRPVYVVLEGEEAATPEPDAEEMSADEVFEHLKDAFDGVEFDATSADGGDAGAAGMDAGLDASPGIDTGEAA